MVPPAASAQVVPVRTFPLAQDHQFRLNPDQRGGMASVSIALPDSLADPFRNPAVRGGLEGTASFTAPGTYHVSRGAGEGWTVPFGVLVGRGDWHGAGALAVGRADRTRFPTPGLDHRLDRCPRCGEDGEPPAGSLRQPRNGHLVALLGRRFPERGVSLGGGVSFVRLRTVDGSERLYPGADALAQSGRILDLRLGLRKEWEGERSLEAVVVRRGFRLTDEVFRLESFWDPGEEQVLWRPGTVSNVDRTRTWGFHLAHRAPLPGEGWSWGWIGTANLHRHPEIPRFQGFTVSEDRGRSRAFQVGGGVARTGQGSRVALDLVWEPIRRVSEAVAAAPITGETGVTVPAGGVLAHNRFRFSNQVARLGVGRDVGLAGSGPVLELDAGLAVRTVHYRLSREDRLAGEDREIEKRWVEWTPTWGSALRLGQLRLAYRGRIVHGTERAGLPPREPIFCVGICVADAQDAALTAPPGMWPGPRGSEPGRVRIRVHQLFVSIPTGGGR